MINLKDKVAVVTGAANEKGRAVCKALANYKAKVVIHYFKNQERAEFILNEIKKEEGDALVYQADIRNRKEVKNLFKEVTAKYGSVNVLVNNAHEKIKRNSFVDTTWEEHQTQIDVITRGSYYCIQESLKAMLKNSEGSIINILNTQVNMPVKGYSSFTTAMSAMVGMTRNLAREVGHDGVRVNMIAPGFIVGKKSEHAPFFIQEKIIEQTPLKRLATPEDVANAVLFLASNLSGFVTGGYLIVDGGMVML